MKFKTLSLGQSGWRFEFPAAIIYIDPYLSNSVQMLDSEHMDRMIPIVMKPDSVTDADFILITHEHMDHCDPHTLPIIARASPKAFFIGPAIVLSHLREWGIEDHRCIYAKEDWFDIVEGLRIIAIPAAHPEIQRDDDQNLIAVGYVIEFNNKKIYLAGDTFARQEIIDVLCELGPIHTAFLPVNEHNFFKQRSGITGNMSVREAFQLAEEVGVKQVVAVHWDMFAINAVDPDEIRLIHHRTKPNFDLLLNPKNIHLGDLQVSIIIRTLNEARYLGELLDKIRHQDATGINYEIIIVDSGSTDATMAIATRFDCRVLHIMREEFSFGRSLNMGCTAARGNILVFISGHCVPVDTNWLARLCLPLMLDQAEYVYGRQHSGPESHYSEGRIFLKYFPAESMVPQTDFYCNNANSAMLKTVWQSYKFDEEITGLEDMEFAQRMQMNGGRVAYIAEAGVYHHHNETWSQVRRRFEREALALQKIMPQVHVSILDAIRYFISSVWNDWRSLKKSDNKQNLIDIINYRANQFSGVFKGNRQHRKMSNVEKENYFYPS